jgi:uncharacterized membrane protein
MSGGAGDRRGAASHFRPRAVYNAIRARPRLLASIGVGLAVYIGLRWLAGRYTDSRVLLAWNAGAVLYLALAWHQVRGEGVQDMRQRATTQDEGRLAILLLTVLAAAAVLLAVGTQLGSVRELEGLPRTLHVLLAAFTILTSWLFMHVLFAMHYAHDFYAARERGDPDPLVFPGTADPLYIDFVYFAFVIGTSGQTADVTFNTSAVRRVGTVHCVLAFFFNASLLALAIHIAAGML